MFRKTRKNRISYNPKNSNIMIQGKRAAVSKDGWIRVQIYGQPFPRGFAHGYLLSNELQRIHDMFPFIIKDQLNTSYQQYEKDCREKITPHIQKLFPEFFEEMQGISSGAISAGFPKITFDFIVAWNSLLSTYTMYDKKKILERCSSFISIENGNIIMAHNTHTDYLTGNTANIIMDIIPEKGNRMVIQMSPGYICSGMDWFICENGIIGCESTIGDINYTPEFGAPYYCRIRQAMQYGNSLDDYVKIMLENNAGDYPCSWFFGDTKRKEIMMFELAFKMHSIERKKEGVFYGVNSVMDPKIRMKETVDKDFGNTKTSSGARNMRLHYLLFEKFAGKMTVANAKTIITDHYDVYLDENTNGNSRTVCKHIGDDYYPFGCTDGKVVDTKMAKKMSFLGRFGLPCGQSFSAKKHISKHPKYKKWESYLEDMPSRPWSILRPLSI